MEIQSIFAWKSLPEAGFSKNVIIDAHRCSGSRIHLDHRSAGRSVIQDHSSDHRFKRLHLTRASVRRASGFVLTGNAEVMRRRTLDRWVVFGQRDVKLSISPLRGHCHLSAVFQSEIVVHGMAEFLLAAEIPLGCLNRCVAKEKLNLLKFSACEMA